MNNSNVQKTREEAVLDSMRSLFSDEPGLGVKSVEDVYYAMSFYQVMLKRVVSEFPGVRWDKLVCVASQHGVPQWVNVHQTCQSVALQAILLKQKSDAADRIRAAMPVEARAVGLV